MLEDITWIFINVAAGDSDETGSLVAKVCF
jgi:hypothetical protein